MIGADIELTQDLAIHPEFSLIAVYHTHIAV